MVQEIKKVLVEALEENEGGQEDGATSTQFPAPMESTKSCDVAENIHTRILNTGTSNK